MSERELASNLRILARYYALEVLGHGGIKELATAIEERHASAGGVAGGPSAGSSAEAFLSHNTGTAFRAYRTAIIEALRAAFAARPDLNVPLGAILEQVLQANGAKLPEAAARFLEENKDRRAGKLSAPGAAAPDLRTPAGMLAALKAPNDIVHAMALAGLAFKDGDTVTLLERRLVEMQHFVFLRASSSGLADKYVAHGLKFATHEEFGACMYFSEKYEQLGEARARAGSRESRGVAFVSGRLIIGIARPGSSPSLTYLVAERPPTDTFAHFSALMTSTNIHDEAFCAQGLCVPVPDEVAKHRLTGAFDSPKSLLRAMPPASRDEVEDWLENPERRRLLRL